MKNVFAVEKKWDTYDGAKFIARSIKEVDGDVVRKQQKQIEDEKNLEKIASLPKWLQWVGLILFGLGGCILLGVMEGISDSDLRLSEAVAKAWHNAGWLIIVGAIAFVLGLAVIIYAIIRRRKVMSSSAYQYTHENVNKLMRETFDALGVPEGADEIDVLGVSYKSKKGEAWNGKPFFSNMVYVHTAVFLEDECLCLATVEHVFKIPLARISRIQTVKGRVFAYGWKSDIPFNKGRYKQYRLLANNAGMVGGKPTYKIIFRDEDYEDYCVHIPCFDIDPILKLTGKTAE